MINEDKIREVWASNPERGFKLLIDFFSTAHILAYPEIGCIT